MNIKKPAFLFLVTLFLVFSARGQSPQDQFDKAVDLYKQAQYWSAYSLFQSIKPENLVADPGAVASYMLLCQIHLNAPDILLSAARWEADYPGAPLKQQIYLQLGNYLIDNSQYHQALNTYLKIRIGQLPKEYRAELTFKTGYAYMQLGNWNQAEHWFSQTQNQSKGTVFKQAANYYRGYVLYSQGKFSQAIPLLTPLQDSPKFGILASIYVLQARFYLEDYQRVITDGERLYGKVDASLKTVLAKLLSESYFALDRIPQARTFFDDYLGNKTQKTRTDRYFSGILYYSLEQYDLSAQQLLPVCDIADSLGQNALYHMGKSYIELKNKLGAMDAFKRAGSMHFDAVIKEDALFNYAKLSFDLNGDIQALSDYRKAYPSSTKLDEIQNYIAAHYFLKQEYGSAVEALQAIKSRTAEQERYLQHSAYLRGLQLYQSGSYREAENYFSLAREPYWIAECLYRNNQLNTALSVWKEYIADNSNRTNKTQWRDAHYNIAYTYFKQHEYDDAWSWFLRFVPLEGNTQEAIADSYLRIGDCAFAQHNYTEAINAYTQAMEKQSSHADYALLQIAMAQGVQNLNNEKLLSLDRLLEQYPTSELYSATLYERGRTFVQTTQYAKAQESFQTILDESRHLAYQSKALIQMGLIQINLQNSEAAMKYYKEVVSRFPESVDTQDAIAGIENLYQAQNNAHGFFDYMASLGMDAGKTSDEKETMVFASAEQLYLTGQHATAVTALRKFIKDYPDSAQSTGAWFYLGECLSQMEKWQEAADAYLEVMKNDPGAFTELATLHYATIEYNMEQYAQAVDAYSSLSSIAVLENNKTEALRGMMWSYYKNKQYRNAIAQANKVLEDPAMEADLQNAQYISAKSHLALGEREEANQLLSILSKEPQFAIGAEATFLLCKEAFDAGDFDKAETLIYNFADTETPQEYWIAHAYLLLGDIYAERGDWAQAKATYLSVQSGYQPAQPDDIAETAALRLKRCEGK